MELANANGCEKQEIKKCGHFSIRGYVADVRRKDSKISWPFPMVNSNKDVEDQTMLPPLHVADFRWWGCENCLKKTDAISAETETRDIDNQQIKAFKQSTCCHGNSFITSHVDALKLLSGLQQASREKIHGGRNVDTYITNIDLDDHENNPSLRSDKKEKKAVAEQPIGEDPLHTPIGRDGSAEENVNQAVYRAFSSSTKDKLTGERISNGTGNVNINFKPDKHGYCLSTGETAIARELDYQGKNASEKAAHTLKGEHSIECCRANYGTSGFSDIVLDKRKQKCTSKSSTQRHHKEYPELSKDNVVKINKQEGKVMSDQGICIVDVDKNEALNTVSGNKSKIHSGDLDESDCESFKDDGNDIVNNVDDELCSSGSLHRKKLRKLRLLDDIIKSEALGAPCNEDRSSIEGAHSKSARDAFTRIGLHTDAKSSTLVQANDKGVIMDKKKKRKMPQDEYVLPMSCPSSATEEIRAFKGDAATRDIGTAIVNSDSDADSSVAISLDSLSRHVLIKHGKNEKFNLFKKKSKMLQSRNSSLMPLLEGVHRVVQNTGGDSIKYTGAQTGCSKSAEDASTERGLHPDLVKESATQSYAKKVIFSDNKCANSHVKDGKFSVKPWKGRTTGEDQIIVGDVDIKYKNAASPFGPSQDAFTGVTQHNLSHVGANRKPAIKKKQNSVFHVEVGASMPQVESEIFSVLCHPEASSGTCNYEKSIAQRHPSVLKNQFDQTATKSSEQATLDDIPMEIVELMAKYQHERFSNAELAVGNSYCSSRKTEKGKISGPTDLTEVLGNEMLQLLHEKNSLMQKVQSNNEESSSRKVAPTKQKTDCYISQCNNKHNTLHSNISTPEQYRAIMGSAASCQELSGGTQFPVNPSSRNCSNQNFSWNEDLLGRRCTPTCLKSSEASHLCQIFPQHGSCREDQHFWSSMIPNRMAFRINNTEKIVAQSSNLGSVSQCLELFPKGNTNVNHAPKPPNPNIHLEKQISKWDSETNKRTYVDHPFACRERRNEYHQKMMVPLDFYANETIPAMHLLRLMDAGVSSTVPLNVDKHQDFSKQPSFPFNHLHKDFTELEVGKPKHIHQPSSDCLLKNYLGKSGYHFHSVPKDNSVGTSVIKDDNVRRSSASRSKFSAKWDSDSLKFQVKGKTKSKKPLSVPKGRKSNRSLFGSSGIHDLQKGFLSASDFLPLAFHSQGMEDSAKCFREDVNNKSGTAWPITRSCATELCTINRNPADFSIPEAGNAYMIRPGDLKRGKSTMPRGRSGLTDLEGHKRQRMMKLTSI